MQNSIKSWGTFGAILGFLVFFTQSPYAQINIGGKPYSFQNKVAGTESLPVLEMPSVSMTQIDKEDQKDNQAGLPPRFGYPFQVELNLNNAGSWTTLDNGDRIWRLSIASPGALSINLTYDAFWLPEGASLYIYNKNRTKVIGGFTAQNNNSPKGQSIGFATGFIFSDQITLEYYEPKAVAGQGEISIDQVVHGYRTLQTAEVFGGSGDCQVNINCSPEGDNWQDVKHSVAMIIVGGNRWCTGSLVITTVQDFKPYFLTADHCLDGWAIPVALDAVANPVAGNWMFVWDYESVGCDNGTDEPTLITTSGAILVANNDDSDFALMRLIENPAQLNPAVSLWYNGWDASGGTGATGGVGIHHPSGDIKKISTYSMDPVSTNQGGGGVFGGNYWSLYFDPTTNGHSVTEGGSSGSPLFNSDQRVIGQLFGGNGISCGDPENDQSIYGKFSVSWDGDNSRRRLHDWLAPDCPVNHVINTNFTQGVEAYYASNEIVSTSDIAVNTLVDFSAGNQIRLLPGFRARAGSFFRAKIGGCEPVAPRPSEAKLLSSVIGAGSYVLPGQGDGVQTAEVRNKPMSNDVSFQCAPNPFSEGLSVQFKVVEPRTTVTLALSDALGRLVHTEWNQQLFEAGQYSAQMELGQLPPGLYYVTLSTPEGRWVQKVVKAE